MQYLVIGHDGVDSEAPARRSAARPFHIERGEQLRQQGALWFGAALLAPDGSMNGSMYLVDFPNQEEFNAWYESEPYVVGDVWQQVEIYPASVRDPWQFSQTQDFYQERMK